MTRLHHRRVQEDDGFTLIEMVIAMLIMATAVTTIVGGLASMAILTSQHRGHAVVETTSRSLAQAVEAAGQYRTALSTGIDATQTSITVADSSLLPPPSADSFVVVGREVMRISANDRTADAGVDAVSVNRVVSGSQPRAHASGAAVVSFIRCSASGNSATDETLLYTPDASTYEATTGLAQTVGGVAYWRPSATTPGTGTFVGRDACAADFASRCLGGVVLPECMSGLVRVDLTSTAASTAGNASTYDDRFRDVATSTSVLVRRSG